MTPNKNNDIYTICFIWFSFLIHNYQYHLRFFQIQSVSRFL